MPGGRGTLRREVDLLPRSGKASGRCRVAVHWARLVGAARAIDAVGGEQQPEVVCQGAIEGIGDRQGQRPGRRLAVRRHATKKRPIDREASSAGRRAGLSDGGGSGVCLPAPRPQHSPPTHSASITELTALTWSPFSPDAADETGRSREPRSRRSQATPPENPAIPQSITACGFRSVGFLIRRGSCDAAAG